jgi:sec-independent protein translocase protein TatA
MGLGTTELILILVIVLVLFGAKKLPEIGGGLARGIKSFRKNISDDPAKETADKDSKEAKDEGKAS